MTGWIIKQIDTKYYLCNASTDYQRQISPDEFIDIITNNIITTKDCCIILYMPVNQKFII